MSKLRHNHFIHRLHIKRTSFVMVALPQRHNFHTNTVHALSTYQLHKDSRTSLREGNKSYLPDGLFPPWSEKVQCCVVSITFFYPAISITVSQLEAWWRANALTPLLFFVNPSLELQFRSAAFLECYHSPSLRFNSMTLLPPRPEIWGSMDTMGSVSLNCEIIWFLA